MRVANYLGEQGEISNQDGASPAGGIRVPTPDTHEEFHNVFAYGLPYGGVNLSGFGGGVNSPETFVDYLRNQTIARPLA